MDKRLQAFRVATECLSRMKKFYRDSSYENWPRVYAHPVPSFSEFIEYVP